MNNTNIENDITTDEQFITHDREEITVSASDAHFWEHTHDEDDREWDSGPDDNPVWIENEDGSGQWSDGWTGAFLESDLPF